jgi:hypothetical protein
MVAFVAFLLALDGMTCHDFSSKENLTEETYLNIPEHRTKSEEITLYRS